MAKKWWERAPANDNTPATQRLQDDMRGKFFRTDQSLGGIQKLAQDERVPKDIREDIFRHVNEARVELAVAEHEMLGLASLPGAEKVMEPAKNGPELEPDI